MANLEYYLAIIAVVVIGVFLIKEVAGCIFKAAITLVALVVVLYLLRVLGHI
ncbi:hypothetical protein [Prevotella corporis]|uniref:hypothetical protein n=1 Tax=Prevotella corporis TaxID=28128 RepID=UPI00040C7709|nr:hypothetical protein [Prevotella corporis]MDQ7736015.1 hypothetical protein [Prevotella corporis]